MTIPMLKRLSLKGFRSFSSAVVDFDNPTFLVGQNGAGKSNLADAFSFIADAMNSRLATVFDQRAGYAAVSYRRAQTGRPPNLSLEVELADLNNDVGKATYKFEMQYYKDSGPQIVRERCILNRRDGTCDEFNRTNKGFSSSVESLKPTLERNALALPLVGGDARFSPVLEFLSKMRAYCIDPTVLRGMQDPDGSTSLRHDGSNTASVLYEIAHRSQDDWETLLALLKGIIPQVINVKSKKYRDKLALEITHKWANSEPIKFEAYNLSDGTLRAVGLLASVFQYPRPRVLVIEEPEATMHAGALGAILDLLRYAKDLMQVVVTTHSPDILDAKWIRDCHLRIVSLENGRTCVAPISETSRGIITDHLMGAGELMRANALTAAPMDDSVLQDSN